MPRPAKDLEEHFLQTMLGLLPKLRGVMSIPHERPDFLVQQDGRTVGIEVTRYMAPAIEGQPIPQAQVGLQELALDIARNAYYRTPGPPLDVLAHFVEHRALDKASAREIGVGLASLLHTSVADIQVFENRDLGWLEGLAAYPELHSLRIFGVPEPDYGVWQAGTGGWGRPAVPDDVIRLVAAKESLLPAYRTEADIVWLLLVFQVITPGDCVRAPQEPVSFSVHTAFDRVLALDMYGPRFVEIPRDSQGVKGARLGQVRFNSW